MNWSDVGAWLKGNAGTGAALVGSLLTGNVPGAVAAGVALVSSATGTVDAADSLHLLQTDSATRLRLAELAQQEQASIRAHIEAITALQLQDAAAEHSETQQTIRAGDTAESVLVRSTRPLQSWVSLIAALGYVFLTPNPAEFVLVALLTLPFTYAGLRGLDKITDTVGKVKMSRT